MGYLNIQEGNIVNVVGSLCGVDGSEWKICNLTAPEGTKDTWGVLRYQWIFRSSDGSLKIIETVKY